MPTPSAPKLLFRIDECPDLMADDCIIDDHGNLVFLSFWARDTAVQKFLTHLTLDRAEQGLDQFHLITEQGAARWKHSSSRWRSLVGALIWAPRINCCGLLRAPSRTGNSPLPSRPVRFPG